VEFAEASHPPEALALGLEADVGLSIDLDENGTVVDVTVLVAAGHGFDEAAVEAVRRFVFAPARRGDVPIASRIHYRYQFRLPEVEAQAESQPVHEPEHALGSLRGWITDEAGAPVPAARVMVGGSSTATNADGFFDLRRLDPGPVDVEVAAQGYEPFAARETIVSGANLPVRYRIRFSGGQYETVVSAAPPDREVGLRTLGTDEIRRVPGTSGDALRAVESMPGVGRPPLGLGLFIIRGSPPDDTIVLLEDLPVPLPYHLGGLATVVASDLVEGIDFHPGSFGPEYGRVAGGVVQIDLRTPRRDRPHVAADVDLVDAGVVAEVPIGSRAGVAVGARRSYLDALLPLFVPDDDAFALTQAPRYWDYQALLDWEPTRRDRLRFLASGSDDVLGVLLADPSASDPAIRGGISSHFLHHGLQARWTRELGEGAVHSLSPGIVYTETEANVGPSIDLRFASLLAQLRDELSVRLGPDHAASFGADVQLVAIDNDVTAPEPPDDRQAPNPIAGEPIRHYEDRGSITNAGVWGELDLDVTSRLKLLPGLRADWFGTIHAGSIDPRLRARYRAHRRLSLQAALGFYSQPPRGYQIVPGFGNPHLEPERGLHGLVGFEEEIGGPFSLEASLFVKLLDDAAAPDPTTNFASTGRGRTFGGEWLLRLRPALPAFGWVAYTLSRTEFRDEPESAWRLGPYDQTHILTVVLGTAIPGGWELGVRYRYTTGFPEAPVIGAEFDADNDVYRPISDPVRMTRIPPFWALDVRLAKRFRWIGLAWTAWLDVQNATNRANPEARVYSFDYSESTYTTGLPILPSLGVRAEY
jgi:TonB family protein